MNRSLAALSTILVAAAVSPQAFAKSITRIERFTTGRHTTVVDRTTVHTKTGVVDVHVKITKPDGKEKTITAKATPSLSGGYSVSRTVTGFNGVSHSSTGKSGGGHGRH